jgi:dTDP-4-amino-4,6-dideoxygalactose transaminase
MRAMHDVPLLDLRAQYRQIRNEIRQAIDRVVESQQFILGPEVEAFEDEIAAYCGCRFAIGMSSGTDALLAALMALDLQSGDEVITTTYSFFATAGEISRVGGTPIFADIHPETFNLDPAAVESKITSRTRAIIPVHLFGQMADIKPILDIARRHNLAVIEDAAQAIGAELDGTRAGAFGDMGCFSFYPSKNLGAFGDAGLVTTNDAGLAARLRMLRVHGFGERYHSYVIGGNFRLDAIQAAVLRVKLKYLDRWTEARRGNASLYRDHLSGNVILPIERHGRHIYNQFVIRHPKRDALHAHLRANGIGSDVYYPVPFHLQKCFSLLGHTLGDFPESERAASEALALPIYPELTADMIRRVASAVMQV